MRALGLTPLGSGGISEQEVIKIVDSAINSAMDDSFEFIPGTIDPSGTTTHLITNGSNKDVVGWRFTGPILANVSLSIKISSNTTLTVTSSLGVDDPGHAYEVTLKRKANS